MKYFNSVEEFMSWYNSIRPHGALDLTIAETPAKAYYKGLPKKEMMIDPSMLEQWEEGGVK